MLTKIKTKFKAVFLPSLAFLACVVVVLSAYFVGRGEVHRTQEKVVASAEEVYSPENPFVFPATSADDPYHFSSFADLLNKFRCGAMSDSKFFFSIDSSSFSPDLDLETFFAFNVLFSFLVSSSSQLMPDFMIFSTVSPVRFELVRSFVSFLSNGSSSETTVWKDYVSSFGFSIAQLLNMGAISSSVVFCISCTFDLSDEIFDNSMVIAGASSYYSQGSSTEGNYDEGYKAGYGEGLKLGSDTGYETGKTEGYNEGYDKGSTAGRLEGYENGYKAGEDVGYDKGYSAGLDVGREDLLIPYDISSTEASVRLRFDNLSQKTLTWRSDRVDFSAQGVITTPEGNLNQAIIIPLSRAIPSGLKLRFSFQYSYTDMSNVSTFTEGYFRVAQCLYNSETKKMLHVGTCHDLIGSFPPDAIFQSMKSVDEVIDFGMWDYGDVNAIVLFPTAVTYLNDGLFGVYNFKVYWTGDEGINYDLGYESGFSAGKVAGNNEGYQSGYSMGYENGLSTADKGDFNKLLMAAIDVPVKAFSSLFNIEILGVNMRTFVLSLLTTCAVVACIKLFSGKLL